MQPMQLIRILRRHVSDFQLDDIGAAPQSEFQNIFSTGKENQLAPPAFLFQDAERFIHANVIVGCKRLVQETRARLNGTCQKVQDSKTQRKI